MDTSSSSTTTAATKTTEEPPPVLTGGCLCGEIRYEIHFPEPATQWPPNSQTCQCTQCRKFTGSLLPPFLSVNPTQILWKQPIPPSTSTYTEYNSSPSCFRGFCRRCGSSLTWRDERVKDGIDLFLGTLDEKWVVGGEGGVGEVVCPARGGRTWWKNVVRGVTDGGVGEKWWEGSKDGKRVE
ncbi:MAG: hypothetical protein M1813_009408 [Trichoglossum hirsutum]|nr:MAG: hypothetical protein M1813_009408 [Trichoglossum hirsutum]